MKDKDKQQLIVTGIIPQYVGINAYMELDSLQNFLRQGDLATSFMLDIEEESVFGLQEKYRETTAVAGIEQKDEQMNQVLLKKTNYYLVTFLNIIKFLLNTTMKNPIVN